MQKTLIAVVSIMVAGMFMIYSISASHNRFAMLLAANGQTYEIDKRSGEVWLIQGDSKIPVGDPAAPRPRLTELEMSPDELDALSVEAQVINGTLMGRLHNGGQTPLTRVVLTVKAHEPDGAPRWSREYNEGLFVKPMASERFMIALDQAEQLGDVNCAVTRAFTRPVTEKSPAGR